MRRAPALPAALLLAALALPGAAGAGDDLLQLKDGRIVDGVRMTKEDGAIVLHYLNGTVRVPLDQVQDFVIEGAPAPDPTTPEEIEKKAQGLVSWKGKWVTPAVRDRERKKESDARKKAIEEHRKHSEWMNRYQFKTKNFDFQSTQPPAQNTEYSELLETYFKEFSKTWSVSVPPKWGKLSVCFYGSEDDFLRSSGASRGTLAYYKWAPPRELDFFYDRNDPKFSVAILFHEANHYLTALMDERFQYPHWVNEAMAEYYGASLWNPETKVMTIGGIQEGRLAEVRTDIAEGKTLALKDLVGSTAREYEHYTWGWSFVHFLMETPKYRTKFMRFFADLANARDIQRKPFPGAPEYLVVKDGSEILKAFLSRMGLKEKDLPALEKEWHDHIDAMEITGTHGLEEGGMRAAYSGRWRFRGPRLLKEAIEKGSRRAEAWKTYAMCLLFHGDEASRAEALATMEKATTLMPMEASLWAMRGYVTWVAGNQAGGKAFVDLAREMAPEEEFFDAENWAKIVVATGSGE